MDKDKNFSRREWFFVVFIIMLVQFIVQFFAFIYAGSSSALGYISISGTIVSIILALLAIIYSYYQSTSQAHSSSSLNSQIEKLIAIVDTVKTNKADFSVEIEQLADIRDKIDSSINLQRASHAQVRELTDVISDLSDNKLSSSYTENVNEDDYFSKLVMEGDNITHLSLLIIYYASTAGVKFETIWDEISKPTILALHGDEATPELLEFYKGSISSVITILKAFGYIESSQNCLPIAMEDDFEEQLKAFRDFIDSRDEAFYKTIIKTLKKVSS